MEVDALQVEHLIPVGHHISSVKPICWTPHPFRQVALHIHIEILVHKHRVLLNCCFYQLAKFLIAKKKILILVKQIIQADSVLMLQFIPDRCLIVHLLCEQCRSHHSDP